MREYRTIQQQRKQKPSRFFESFIQSKGPSGVARASVGEIQKALKSFYIDLAYGNVVQDKYVQVLLSDPRIIQEACMDVENKALEANIILQSLDFAAQGGHPISAQPMFRGIHNKYMIQANTYGVLLEGLRGFAMTQDPSYLVAISTKLNGVMMRGSKQQLML